MNLMEKRAQKPDLINVTYPDRKMLYSNREMLQASLQAFSKKGLQRNSCGSEVSDQRLGLFSSLSLKINLNKTFIKNKKLCFSK
ncbi:MAG: hypothetical protein ACHQXK_06510, partial [Methanosarcina thermophila]